jgi:hypothetical protein
VLPQRRGLEARIDNISARAFANDRKNLTPITGEDCGKAAVRPFVIADVAQGAIDGLIDVAMSHRNFVNDQEFALTKEFGCRAVR